MNGIFLQEFINLRKRILEKYFSNMNEMQQQAVFKTDGALLILAGAGSGKTTVVVNRIANLLMFGDAYHSNSVPEHITDEDMQFLKDYLLGNQDDVVRLQKLLNVNPPSPWQILAITFTNKAASELRSRLSEILGEENAKDIQASTFHSACVRILRAEIGSLGYDRKFTIYDSDDQQRLIKEILHSLNLDDKTFSPKSVLSVISEVKDKLISSEEYTKSANTMKLQKIADIYEAYQKKLKAANALDFDDIITITVKLFMKYPEILQKYQNRFKYISVDEYQDTNHSQYKLISLLAQNHGNLCVVGDDDQSIYRFRGATIENIFQFESQYPDCKVIKLEQNYRSTKMILDAANQVIQNNVSRKGKSLWTAGNTGDSIILYNAYDERDEAKVVADFILKHVAEGGKYNDNAILYRLNAISNTIEQAFVHAGIPYKIVGGTGFYNRKEIKDAISYLSVVNNPSDTTRMLRIINEPKRGIGTATLMLVNEVANLTEIPSFEVILNADKYPPIQKRSKGLMEFAQIIQDARQLEGNVPLADLFDHMMRTSGYYECLKLDKSTQQTRYENLQELKSNMNRYEMETCEPSLSGFLEKIALYTDLDSYDEQADSVVMMTLHASKGLEFDNVFIMAIEEGIFPGIRSIGNSVEIEEERRLAYVGITRAKKHLYLMTAKARMIFGQTQKYRLSRFVSEISDELIDKQGRVENKAPVISKPQPQIKPVLNSGFSQQQPTQSDKSDFIFNTGDRVKHRVFGVGTILNVTSMADDNMVEIAFDKVGTKKIMSNVARLLAEEL